MNKPGEKHQHNAHAEKQNPLVQKPIRASGSTYILKCLLAISRAFFKSLQITDGLFTNQLRKQHLPVGLMYLQVPPHQQEQIHKIKQWITSK